MKKKSIALLMAVIMMFGAVGATIAWLWDMSDTVTNTFTFGDVNIKLDEAPVDEDGKITTGNRGNGNAYDLIPGREADKDPMVTVEAGSEDCFVFVKIVETNNTYSGDTEKDIPALEGKIVTYTVGANWKEVEPGVYVYGNTATPEKVSAGDELKEIISDNKVTINSALTKAQIEDIKSDQTTPELEFVAYAIQADNLGDADTPAEIWALIK